MKRRDVKQGKDDIEVGDKVRLKAAKKYKGGIGQDAKFFSDNWSNGVYVISHVRRAANQLRNLDLSGNVGDNTRAVTYKVKGSDLVFTRNDVQKVPADTETTAIAKQKEKVTIEKQIRAEAIAKEKRAKQKANAPKKKVSRRKYRYDKQAYIVAKPIFFKGIKGFTRVLRYGTIQDKGTNLSEDSKGIQSYSIVWDNQDKKSLQYVYDRPSVDDLDEVSLALVDKAS